MIAQREGVDHQPQQHEIVQEAAQFLGAEPEDVGERSRIALASALLLAQQQQAEQRQRRDEERQAARLRPRSANPATW